jgi:hypothetical protein
MNPDFRDLVWRKSARSGVNGNCVEIAQLCTAIAVRDSKSPAGPVLVFTPAQWTRFVTGAKAGDFDI